MTHIADNTTEEVLAAATVGEKSVVVLPFFIGEKRQSFLIQYRTNLPGSNDLWKLYRKPLSWEEGQRVGGLEKVAFREALLGVKKLHELTGWVFNPPSNVIELTDIDAYVYQVAVHKTTTQPKRDRHISFREVSIFSFLMRRRVCRDTEPQDLETLYRWVPASTFTATHEKLNKSY